MLTTFLRRDVLLDLVGEEDHTDLVVVLDGTERQGSRNLRHHLLLHLVLRTELQGSADVDEQHHGKLALFLEHLDIRTVEACGYVPVDIAHIITKLILTYFAERHSPTLEGRMVLSGEDVVTQSACLDLDLANLLQYLRRFHQLNPSSRSDR